MPLPSALGYVSWDPRGYFHYHERPGGRFISKERFLSIIRPSLAGYHGWRGLFLPYQAFAQILGPGVPSPGHAWWRTIKELPVPTRSIDRSIGAQYRVSVTVMDRAGNVSTHRLYTGIGKGYSVERGNQMVAEFLQTGTGSPPIELEEEEELTEIGRSFEEIYWQPTFGIGPRPVLAE